MTPHDIITAVLAQVPAASFPELAQIIINTLEDNGFVVAEKPAANTTEEAHPEWIGSYWPDDPRNETAAPAPAGAA